jgi:hypothetical protein
VLSFCTAQNALHSRDEGVWNSVFKQSAIVVVHFSHLYSAFILPLSPVLASALLKSKWTKTKKLRSGAIFLRISVPRSAWVKTVPEKQ